jgi:hypothetical protein
MSQREQPKMTKATETQLGDEDSNDNEIRDNTDESDSDTTSFAKQFSSKTDKARKPYEIKKSLSPHAKSKKRIEQEEEGRKTKKMKLVHLSESIHDDRTSSKKIKDNASKKDPKIHPIESLKMETNEPTSMMTIQEIIEERLKKKESGDEVIFICRLEDQKTIAIPLRNRENSFETLIDKIAEKIKVKVEDIKLLNTSLDSKEKIEWENDIQLTKENFLFIQLNSQKPWTLKKVYIRVVDKIKKFTQ